MKIWAMFTKNMRDVFFKNYVYNTLKYNKLYFTFPLDKVV